VEAAPTESFLDIAALALTVWTHDMIFDKTSSTPHSCKAPEQCNPTRTICTLTVSRSTTSDYACTMDDWSEAAAP
jgi:hypothetical protein